MLPDSMKRKDLPERVGLFFSYNRKAFFSDCPDQCAALYLVRILTAARCAGFRQAKSPGRVGRCRIPCGGAHSMSQRGVYGKERDRLERPAGMQGIKEGGG